MTTKDETLRGILARQAVLPIMTIRRVDTALRIAESLLAGGLSVMEITLRTVEGAQAIAAIRSRLPEMGVGAGTLLRPEDFDRAAAAGAQFGVSPGMDRALAEAAVKSALPFLPGVQTASEVMAAVGCGFRTLKFYPARVAHAVLADFGNIFQEVVFVPTGSAGGCPRVSGADECPVRRRLLGRAAGQGVGAGLECHHPARSTGGADARSRREGSFPLTS
jgi:2-dehydro-3-deoxyphosphogluconate aldolase/(4S)-4-hydroxy-2-oxoglutarate aldolase